MSKKIIFFGTDNFSSIVLQKLIDDNYDIIAVVTKPDSISGRGQKYVESYVKKIALENSIEVWQPQKISEINEKINSLGFHIAGVLASFGKIIPKSTIDLFIPGIINVHPSLLPKYRGPSPIESAIENGDDETGISIIKLTKEMDAGPIYGQSIYKLNGDENRIELRKALAYFGSKILIDLLPGILNGSIMPVFQDDKRATYCKLLDKKNNEINLNEISAGEAERLIRAHVGFPKTKMVINGHLITILKSHVSNEKEDKLDIIAKDKKYLSIDELTAPSGRSMTNQDFINGYL
ncbi:MAG: methionyl-tRNA formyltransferase [Candidatus Saccharibacteria bacterium]